MDTKTIMIRLDRKDSEHEMVFAWLESLPRNKKGIKNLNAKIVEALNYYIKNSFGSPPVKVEGKTKSLPETQLQKVNQESIEKRKEMKESEPKSKAKQNSKGASTASSKANSKMSSEMQGIAHDINFG